MERSKKRNRSMWAVGLAVLVLAVVTSCLAGFTYAKYTSKIEGSASGSIAKWQWTVNGTEAGASTEKFTMSLGNILDTATDNADADVAEGKIAPGTKGSYTFTIANASEVNGQYAIDYTAAEGPIKFYSDAACETELADVVAGDATKLTMSGATNTATITIYWKWNFETENGDEADTALGVAAETKELLTAEVTFTQID